MPRRRIHLGACAIAAQAAAAACFGQSPGGPCAGGFVSRLAFRFPHHGLLDRLAGRSTVADRPTALMGRWPFAALFPRRVDRRCPPDPDPHAFWPPSPPRSFSPGIGHHQPCERRSCAGASKSADREAGGWASGSSPDRDPCPLRWSGPLLPWALPLSGVRTPRWRAKAIACAGSSGQRVWCIARPSVPGHRFRRQSAHGFCPGQVRTVHAAINVGAPGLTRARQRPSASLAGDPSAC